MASSPTTASGRNAREGDADLALLPLRAPSTQEIVADVLRSRIALGTYAPGDRLPTERSLSEALGVGRMTIRAAIRELRDEGLLDTIKGRGGGSVVREHGPRKRLLRGAVERYVDDLRQSYEFRAVVEPVIARWAAGRASATQRRRLDSIAAQEASNLRLYRALDSRFHLAVAEASENRNAVAVIGQVRAEAFIWADALWGDDWERHRSWVYQSEDQHRRIAAAIVARDGDAAAALMADHLSAADSVFEAVIGEVVGS